MTVSKYFHNKSYAQHAEQFNQFNSGGIKEGHAKTWLETNTVDAWRHERMYKILDPVLNAEPEATWLTVGDGRYGKDAHHIHARGSHVLASDISGVLLKEAKENGYIGTYQIENAESLSFEDNTFDYVFCKEAYHHFPRPVLALYEMLRVAKKGVLLIEPNDVYIRSIIMTLIGDKIIKKIRSFFGKEKKRHGYEESGNYVYTISKREIEKIALGLNYKVVAFKGLNDAYLTGVEYENISANGPLLRKLQRLIRLRNLLCKLSLMDYSILLTIIFKNRPTDKLNSELSTQNFEIIHLPDNPYISS